MSEKRFCPQCGAELNGNAKFCRNCGAPVPEQQYTPEQPEQQYTPEQPGTAGGTDDNGGRKFNIWMILFIAAAAVAVVFIIGFFIARSNYHSLLASQDEVVETVVDEDIVFDEPEEEVEVIDEPEVAEPEDVEEEETEVVEEETAEVTEEETADAETTKQAVSKLDEETVKAGVQDLYNQLVEYSVSDSAKFADLIEGASDEDIESYRQMFSGIYSEHYDREIVTVAQDNNPYYYVQVCSYTVAGTYPNASISDHYLTLPVSYDRSGWKLDNSQGALDIMNSPENLQKMYPSGLWEAIQAGRNASAFGPWCLWLDETDVFVGDFDAEVFFMWQNEDGSVDVGVWYGNGLDGAVSVKQLSLTITDNDLGTVLDSTGSVSEMINTGYGRVVDYHFEASEVLTGTQEWGSMSASVSTRQTP